MLLKKAAVPFLLVGASFAVAQNVVHQPVHSDQVIPIQTSLNHISIIMLPERIVRVATGSEAMQIEWHENNVFIKPLQGGQATNLMVWTEHQFSAYELEAPGDVKQMTFVLDESASMKARDVSPSRFDVARSEAAQLVRRLGEGAEVMGVEAGGAVGSTGAALWDLSVDAAGGGLFWATAAGEKFAGALPVSSFVLV